MHLHTYLFPSVTV